MGKKTEIKKKQVESDSESSSSSSEDEAPKVVKNTSSVRKTKKASTKKVSDSSSSEDEAPVVKKSAKKVVKKAESSSDESSSSEDEKPVTKKAATKKVDAKKADSSSDESSDDEKKPEAKKVAAKKAESSSDESSSSEDEKPVAKKAASKKVSAKKADSSSDESSDDEKKPEAKKVAAKKVESSSDESSDEEKPEEPVAKKSKKESSEEEEEPKAGTEKHVVQVLGMPFSADADELRQFFSKVGEPVEIELPEMNKGTAIVTFSTLDQATKAIALDGEYMGPRYLKIRMFQPRAGGSGPSRPAGERPEGCTTVFCGNLSFQIDEDSLKDFFKGCGEVKQIRWGTDKESGDFKGYGHCEFFDEAAVDKAVQLHGEDLLGRAIRLDFAVSGGARKSFGGGEERKSFGGGDRKSFGGGGGRGGFGGGQKRSFGGGSGGGAPPKRGKFFAEGTGNKITFD